MTEIVLAHDQKHVPGHYFSVGPNASPKRNLGHRSERQNAWQADER